MEDREAFVKRTIVITGISLRVLMLVTPFILYAVLPVPGFRPDQFNILMCLLLPLTSLYITLFIKFIIQNRYQLSGKKLGTVYVSFGHIILLFLNIAELLTITWKGIDNTVLEDKTFFFLIALFESGFGIYAGFYLSGLFEAPRGYPDRNVKSS